jgi:hypothetical protein
MVHDERTRLMRQHTSTRKRFYGAVMLFFLFFVLGDVLGSMFRSLPLSFRSFIKLVETEFACARIMSEQTIDNRWCGEGSLVHYVFAKVSYVRRGSHRSRTESIHYDMIGQIPRIGFIFHK